MAFRTLSSTEALMVPGMSAGRAVDSRRITPELPAEIRILFRFSALSLLVLFSFALAEAQTPQVGVELPSSVTFLALPGGHAADALAGIFAVRMICVAWDGSIAPAP